MYPHSVHVHFLYVYTCTVSLFSKIKTTCRKIDNYEVHVLYSDDGFNSITVIGVL